MFCYLALLPLLAMLGFFGWFFTIMFEGDKPGVTLQPLPEFLSKPQKLTLSASDSKRGLKAIRVSIKQGGRETILLEEGFPFEGFLNRQGTHHYDKDFLVDPSAISLTQGEVELSVHVWDYSKRGGGNGNVTLIQHRMTVDTIPPAIRVISRMHNINVGGSGLIVYQVSSDTQESGVFVNDLFFPGFPEDGKAEKGLHVCFYAIPYDSSPRVPMTLSAKDRAGNVSKTGFYYHVRTTGFRQEKMDISDRFLDQVLPYFSFYPTPSEEGDLKRYLKINNDLRKENHLTLMKLTEKTTPRRLWEGTWLRLSNAATMARFADHRLYSYKGEKVDEQTHLGMDLASLSNSPVEAANSGRVIYADRLGIYGLTVVLDHGQGLSSLYGHLSKLEVAFGQEIGKGDTIGFTGQTGLAAGDHLHFAILVNGIFVNPIEWWDEHWIRDNITKKLALLNAIDHR